MVKLLVRMLWRIKGLCVDQDLRLTIPIVRLETTVVKLVVLVAVRGEESTAAFGIFCFAHRSLVLMC